MIIAPALLNTTFEDFACDVKKVEGLFSYAQIDVMDGEFVPNTSFSEIEKINDLHSPLKWELHLMVKNPLAELEKWARINNVFRVIFHAESDGAAAVIAWARERNLEVGVALNPETPLEKISGYMEQLNVVQFMTVHPGRQGNPFLPEVGERIKVFTTIAEHPLCAVDGGVNTTTIPMLKNWGVDIANVGSALMKAPDITKAHQQLMAALTE
jgi:ribulose-phosphate 3-epimerase